jgi:hypothetical protein
MPKGFISLAIRVRRRSRMNLVPRQWRHAFMNES